MEKFILRNADAVKIALEDYELFSDFNKLKDITKKPTSKFDSRFKKLFKALLEQKAPDILKLANWIKHLKENPYQVDITALKGM